jgi:hypothetical protein
MAQLTAGVVPAVGLTQLTVVVTTLVVADFEVQVGRARLIAVVVAIFPD